MQQTILAQRSIGSELRALLAVAGKEWKIFRRYPSWVLAVFIWPVLFPFGYIFTAKALGGPDGASLAAFGRLAGTEDYVSFIVLGSTLWMWLNMTLWDVGMYLRGEQMRGTLESNWLCPTWRLSLMLGGALTKLATSLVFMAVALVEFRLIFGVRLLSGNLGLALLVLLLVIPTIHGIGIAFASLVLRFKEANAMVFLVRGLFMIFCGITYPIAVLPGWMQSVAAALPLTYAIRDIRAALLANASFADLLPDLQILAAFALALPALGYTIFYLTERRSRRTGDLGQY
ncbi:MAG: ABC transporter permease [Kouleothrix sp.]|nr:ABC transporter permease [Kouleothrix sp.]